MPTEVWRDAGRAKQFARPRTIQARIVMDQLAREVGIGAHKFCDEMIERAIDVAARQRRAGRPCRRYLRKPGFQTAERLLRKPAISRDLATEDRQQWGHLRRGVNLEDVVPRHRRGVRGIVVVERPNSGEGMEDLAPAR